MEMESLQELFVDELRDLYSAENQLLKAMPRMAKKAKHPELRKAIETHMQETQGQVERLNQVFEMLEVKSKGKKCLAMEGLLNEAKEHMQEKMAPDVMDAALIGMSQKIEHYEIAGYGTARTYAKLLGNKDVTRLLQQTLDEEGKTDKLLSKLAESSINVEAATPN